jgi:colanic acid/amylovoran biosynthesis glycosyltransferase
MSERIPVGFLRHNFLHRSESWLYGSMQGLEEGGRYHVRVFALRRYLAERFPWTDVTLLGGPAQAWYWLTRRAPAFTRWANSVRLIHAHLGPTGPFAMAGALAAGVPFVVSYYGHDVVMFRTRERFEPWAWWYTLLRRRVFARAARIVVLSEHMRRALIAQGCPEEKVAVVRLGVDVARFAGAAREVRDARQPLRVLMVGREVDKKGFDDGLAAVRGAIDRGVPCEVTMLGTGGPLAPYLRLKARSLGVDVRWLEPAHPVAAAMAGADVLLAPSRTAADGDEEGTPTVIVEAGAAGLPVVSTRHAGIPEQIDDGVSGLLAGERDIWGLTEALATMARDPVRAHAMGVAGRARMTRDYSLAAHRARLHAVYDAVLAPEAA